MASKKLIKHLPVLHRLHSLKLVFFSLIHRSRSYHTPIFILTNFFFWDAKETDYGCFLHIICFIILANPHSFIVWCRWRKDLTTLPGFTSLARFYLFFLILKRVIWVFMVKAKFKKYFKQTNKLYKTFFFFLFIQCHNMKAGHNQ